MKKLGFFAEFTLSEILRSLCSLRMTRSEGLRMIEEIDIISITGKRVSIPSEELCQ